MKLQTTARRCLVLVLQVLGAAHTLAPGDVRPEVRSGLGAAIGAVLLSEFRRPYITTRISRFSQTVEGAHALEDLVSELLSGHTHGQLVVQYDAVPDTAVDHRRPWTHCLLLAENYETLRAAYPRLSSARYDVSGYYVIGFTGNDTGLATVNRLFNDLWSREIVNVVVAFWATAGVQLWTYVPFSPGLCRVPKPVLLLDPAGTRRTVDWFARKNLHFYNCPLRVGTFETRPFTLLQRAGAGGLGGFEGDLLASLEQKLAFTVDLRVPPRAQQWGRAAFENSTGIMRMLYTAEVDLGIACLGVSSERSAMLKVGKVHLTTTLVLVVPPGRPYSPFEKLLLPFRSAIWWVTLGYVGAGLATIAALYCRRRRRSGACWRHVVGHRVPSPALNLLRVLFASPLTHPPAGNLPRTLLLLWLGLCQLLQFLYQGSLYRYLQLASTHPPMATMDEVVRSGALFHVPESARRLFDPFPRLVPRLRYLPTVTDNIAGRLRWMGEHPDDPDTCLCTRDHVAYYNLAHRRDGHHLWVAREPVTLYSVTVLYPKRSMLTSGFDEQIEHIVSSGLLKYWAARYGDYDFRLQHAQAPVSAPTPIRLGELRGAFGILGCLLAVCVLVFLLEFCAPCTVSRCRRYFG
ncbi:uncharacterized protein LOC131213206 [Anopheles bellator]|uniref:uncharacterized protein LOC131213206 n=1 Tax=Anopheles bellator TaxID=139047 RepID=UPI002649575B|nr:uncharacterized protein LOC131213206 [Anopheles bellator]